MANPALNDTQRKIKELHLSAMASAGRALEMALKCGALLAEAQAAVPYGEWGFWLKGCGIPRETARRYIRLSKEWDARKQQIEQGVTLCELYRDYGLMKPLGGGGMRMGKDGISRHNAAKQLIFSFEAFTAGLDEVLRFEEQGKNPFSDLARDQVEAEHAKTKRVLALQEEALRTIDA
jgi:hypothetical protein